MTARPHIEESLQREIGEIRAKVTEMCALAVKALRDCVDALIRHDRQAAYAIILRDHNIDALEKELDRLCLEFIIRQQPVAGLLRFAYATIKVNYQLERVGDYAESIARQILRLLDEEADIPAERFVAMADLAIPMLEDAIRAFAQQDAELARRTMGTEEAVDALRNGTTREFVALARQENLPFDVLNPLVVITRRFERVSDQARNICIEVLYMCTGEDSRHPNSDVFRVLFVDGDNACRSQMAEAVGASMRLPQFVFASAGVEPRPIEPGTVAFMREKGLDVALMAPKAIHQVPDLDRFDVIIALAPEAKRVFPQHPRKSILLDWSVRDPSRKAGTAEEIRAAYEKTFQFIQGHIKALADAILANTVEDASA